MFLNIEVFSIIFCHVLIGPDLDLEIGGDTVAVDLAAREGGGLPLLAPADPAKGQGPHRKASPKVGQGHLTVNQEADLHREMDNRMINLPPGVLSMIESKRAHLVTRKPTCTTFSWHFYLF
jgi:hypothetical protein